MQSRVDAIKTTLSKGRAESNRCNRDGENTVRQRGLENKLKTKVARLNYVTNVDSLNMYKISEVLMESVKGKGHCFLEKG